MFNKVTFVNVYVESLYDTVLVNTKIIKTNTCARVFTNTFVAITLCESQQLLFLQIDYTL